MLNIIFSSGLLRKAHADKNNNNNKINCHKCFNLRILIKTIRCQFYFPIKMFDRPVTQGNRQM